MYCSSPHYSYERSLEAGRWILIASMVILLSLVGSSGGSEKGFGDRLFEEGDYLRAIGEYKRMSFFSVDPGSALYFQYRIGACYRQMGDYGSARGWYDKVLLKSGGDEELERKVVIGSAVCLINQGNTEYARIILDDFQTRSGAGDSLSYLLGVSYLKERQLKAADDAFGKIQSPALRDSAAILMRNTSSRKLKSPKTALLLSILVPGAGQVYAARPFKGFVSFSLNLSLGYLTYKAFSEDRRLDGFLILYFGLQRFYFGNLEQARQYTAEYNRNINESIRVK